MSDSRIGVVGVGYVGLTTAAGMACLGHRVCAVDVDARRIERLRRGQLPLREPDLDRLVAEGVAAGRLLFSTDFSPLRECEVVFVSVPTPMSEGGDADLSAVDEVMEQLSRLLRPDSIVVDKSTVPVGTARRVAQRLAPLGIHVVSNPEFLRESHAVEDFLHPARIVIGAASRTVGRRVAALFDNLIAPVQHTSYESAELAKYASNAFLAVKVSFINELAQLCESLDADVRDVANCMGLDPRIGPAFLQPGPGWGGSCLPKDTAALLHTARRSHSPLTLVDAAVSSNAAQAERTVRKVRRAITGRPDGCLAGARIGLLGLAFKAGTADLRHSPAIRVAHELADASATLTAYDPMVSAEAAGDLQIANLTVVDDPYLVGKAAHAVVVLTECPQFRNLNWRELGSSIENPIVVDTRNLLDRESLDRAGFTLLGNGIS
ncbi:UDP-glucose/GDP-mannose dehydrogenase family protein [Skermania sp. ID1734]|uniref:UDP-glucose dehydrogenase family protein n=1 Tax=Skermania sp. ID1734 TaxID=2597516 RepID=UPI002105CC63|nr:UDP-glucose/GDP-mannose dehydrogenase family protein [Skermania sp. ID1734]